MASRSSSQSSVARSRTTRSGSNTADGSEDNEYTDPFYPLWRAYSFIYSLKRNMMTTKRAEDLVIVHNNLRLKHLELDEPSEA
jgi:hypothetical protein